MKKVSSTLTSSVSLIAFLALSVLQTPGLAQAADPKFRLPVNVTLSPSFSTYFDHDSGSGVKNYYCKTDTVYDGHTGTDIRANYGTPVYAAMAGGLYESKNNCDDYGSRDPTSLAYNCGGGYGNYAKIDHEGTLSDGIGWITLYAHMKKNSVAYPSSVYCGKQIGLSASSGRSDGPHVHFEVRKSGATDPFKGDCSRSTSLWTVQNASVPVSQCSNVVL